MVQTWNSDNRAISLYCTLRCKGKKRFFMSVGDYSKPNSRYARREVVVDGERTIFFSFPITPQMMAIEIINIGNKADTDFSATYEEKPLRTYNIWTNEDTREFLKLNFNFSQVCGYTAASPKGRLFSSRDCKFNIKYFPVIIDYMTNRPMSTPARIGHSSGIIEVAKNKFDKYTFAERVVILLHEYSHKYRNPQMGLDISNETGADINALYIYLGLGFSKIDAIYVFANVFLKAQTESNLKRMRAIMDYIQRFESGDYAQLS